MPHLPRNSVSDLGTPTSQALQRGESSSAGEAPGLILKVASSALLSLVLALAEPKDKANRAFAADSNGPKWSGQEWLLCRADLRAPGRGSLKQVSMETGRLRPRWPRTLSSAFGQAHHLYHKLVTSSLGCFCSPKEETKAPRSLDNRSGGPSMGRRQLGSSQPGLRPPNP